MINHIQKMYKISLFAKYLLYWLSNITIALLKAYINYCINFKIVVIYTYLVSK